MDRTKNEEGSGERAYETHELVDGIRVGGGVGEGGGDRYVQGELADLQPSLRRRDRRHRRFPPSFFASSELAGESCVLNLHRCFTKRLKSLPMKSYDVARILPYLIGSSGSETQVQGTAVPHQYGEVLPTKRRYYIE